MSYNPRTKAGKAGRAASPWGRFPHCETPRAIKIFAKAKREREIAEAVAKLKKGEAK